MDNALLRELNPDSWLGISDTEMIKDPVSADAKDEKAENTAAAVQSSRTVEPVLPSGRGTDKAVSVASEKRKRPVSASKKTGAQVTPGKRAKTAHRKPLNRDQILSLLSSQEAMVNSLKLIYESNIKANNAAEQKFRSKLVAGQRKLAADFEAAKKARELAERNVAQLNEKLSQQASESKSKADAFDQKLEDQRSEFDHCLQPLNQTIEQQKRQLQAQKDEIGKQQKLMEAQQRQIKDQQRQIGSALAEMRDRSWLLKPALLMLAVAFLFGIWILSSQWGARKTSSVLTGEIKTASQERNKMGETLAGLDDQLHEVGNFSEQNAQNLQSALVTLVAEGKIGFDDLDKTALSSELKQQLAAASKNAIPDGFLSDRDRLAKITRDFAIYFSRDTELVDPRQARLFTRAIGQIMKENPELRLRVIGYSDPTGSVPFNRKLSLERAKLVAGLVAAWGIAPDRLIALGRGESEQLAAGSGEGHPSRRVVFEPAFINEQMPNMATTEQP